MITAPPVDGRRVESFLQELLRFAPYYTPDLNLADEQGAGVALMKIFSQLAEIVALRLDQAPQKHFVAFLDKLGITLLPARPATAAVTFRLASGFEEAVRVPIGTRVTAPGPEDEIPFETTNELLAIPGVLTAVYGVDPLQDLIFSPPPGFLKQEARAPTELSYEIQSFVPATSDRLQLNHTTELEPGSFIRIGCKQKKVIRQVDEGNFITLSEPVGEDFAEGTIAVPIRNFEVFNGIDRQEHILYIGHNSLLTIKERVEITLEIDLSNSAKPGLQSLDLDWQFWTSDETRVPEEEEHWHPLDVRLDGTAGLAASGRIVLVKPKDLEIKPRKVGGKESRWIRAKLKDKLPVGPGVLPEIETIRVGVNTQADDKGIPIGIPADQGFYNATPLEVQIAPGIGFFPFGAEPRQFDQFYVASKEAFSKRQARAEVSFDLDLQTLAAPSVIKSNAGIRAYSIGLQRRIFELDLSKAKFNVLENPFDAPITGRPEGSRFFPVEDSVPVAITNTAGDLIYVFINTEDALDTEPNKRARKLWVHRHLTGAPVLKDLDAPGLPTEKKQILFNPAAVVLPTGAPTFARVFVVGGDGILYSRDILASADPPSGSSWQSYTDADSGPGEPWQSSPYVTKSGSTLLVFITGSNGVVYRLTIAPSATPAWTALTPTATSGFRAESRPFAQVISGNNAKVFVVGSNTARNLFECDTSRPAGGGKFFWSDLGHPGSGINTGANVPVPAPVGYIEDVGQPIDSAQDIEGKHIFLRSADNRLWERLDDTGSSTRVPRWEDRTRLEDPDLRDSPAVYVDASSTLTTINVLSASDRNSLVAWEFEIRRGQVGADPLQSVLLKSTASGTDDFYLGKNLTVIASGSPTAGIIKYDGALKLVRLAASLPAPLTLEPLEIDVPPVEQVGPARSDTNKLLVLHSPATGRRNTRVVSLQIDNINRDQDVRDYSRLTGVVLLDGSIPIVQVAYSLFVEITESPTEFRAAEDTSSVPELSWEYWNGRGWLSLTGVTDGTHNLLKNGAVTFEVPKDIEATEVAGQENFWIRARLVGGDYGRETFKIEGPVGNQKIVSEKSSLRPPKVRVLLISYKASPVFPENCLTLNNLDYLDQTAAAKNKDSHFPPFETLEDTSFTIFFGFDKTFRTGPVRLLVDAAERDYDETKPPEFAWSFRKDRKWKTLDAEDGSIALTRQGILTVSASEELTLESRFGESLYWIKGSLRSDRADSADEAKRKSSADYPLPLLRGIFLNTVWATHGETITDEIAGSGDGEPNQTHTLQQDDVLQNEDIRVQETLSAEERERIERELGKESIVDREDLGGTWVRWKAVKALFDCGPQDRCYEIDRADGILRFGDGEHGRIVPAGVDNIRAFRYRTGGGAAGNVDTNTIEALATAVAGIESVFNPAPAGGGSDKADTGDMLTIGPRRISHGDRAVSVEDFEELAYEASRQIAKVRCLGTTNLVRSGTGLLDPCDPGQLHQALVERGRVSLIIVPDSPDPRPCPSLELRRAVKKYLQDRAPSVIAAGERIVVRPPDYVTVGMNATIFVSTLEKAATVESEARTRLEKFLHPIRGGPDGNGWEFGRPITKSDVFALLERIPDVDRVENLLFEFGGQSNSDRVDVGPNHLLASGEHKLAIKKA